VGAAAIGAAVLLVPSFAFGMATASAADLLVIGGLLALGRFVLALAAMDTGTAFGGIGASREMMFSVFGEPVLLLVAFTLALLAGTTNLDIIASVLGSGALGLRVSLALALVALMAVAIVECGRIPVDNPATHLELTMVHEAMVLEYSGRHLALIEFAAGLKLLLWFTLIATLFAPFGMAPPGFAPVAWGVGAAIWLGKMAVLAVALAVFETTRAKMRVFRVPEFLGVAVLLALLAAVLLLVSQGFA
jgi:formate hydrogenlyase subunit 4